MEFELFDRINTFSMKNTFMIQTSLIMSREVEKLLLLSLVILPRSGRRSRFPVALQNLCFSCVFVEIKGMDSVLDEIPDFWKILKICLMMSF